MTNWNSHHAEKIKTEIRALMKTNTDINATISSSSHLFLKQIDYNLEKKYRKQIEIQLVVVPDTTLSAGEFLVYAGERLQLDYVDILFGEYNEINRNQLIERLNKQTVNVLTKWIENLDEVVIFTIDETKSCQTFMIRTDQYCCFLIENWLI